MNFLFFSLPPYQWEYLLVLLLLDEQRALQQEQAQALQCEQQQEEKQEQQEQEKQEDAQRYHQGKRYTVPDKIHVSSPCKI